MAQFFRLDSLDLGVTFLAGNLFLMLLIMVAYFKRVMNLLKSPSYKTFDQIKQSVQESEILFERLSKMLEERKEIANRLIAELDLRIEMLRAMKGEAERRNLPMVEEIPRKEQEEWAVKMAEQGQPYLEIARQTGLSVGEIQFLMNLRKCHTSAPPKTP